MKFLWYGEEIEVKDELVRGICKVCGFPVLKQVETDLLEKVWDDDLFLDLEFDIGNDLHEMCYMDPKHFLPAKKKIAKISSLKS